jgi:MFS family permease
MEALRLRVGLNGLNFFVAAVQTGFGPFFSVYLTEQLWSQVDIGLALSIGTASVLALQLPAGVLVDHIHLKRIPNAIGLILLGVSVLILLIAPTPWPVWTAQFVHAVASCILTPAIAALTLALTGHEAFSEQLGVNARWASLGNAAAAGALGGVAYLWSNQAVFVVTAALVLPALATIRLFRHSDRVAEEDHPSLQHPRQRRERNNQLWHIFEEPALHIFAVGAVLFQFSNAAMLPLALNELASRTGQSSFVVSAAIMVPQIVVAAFSPKVGRWAQRFGRRPVLLIGFAALPLRGLLFMTLPTQVPLVAIELLDGVSGAVFGLMIPLIAADVTRRTGYLNLAITSLGLAGGLGATFSTTIAGWIADSMGAPAAFLALAIVGGAAWLLLWSLMPETRPVAVRQRRSAHAATAAA